MKITESVRMAFQSLGANKMRSGLTMLGIIIGTGAVIALLSVGEGAQAAITEQVRSIGANLIFIFSGQIQQSSGQMTLHNIEPLTRQDAEALADPVRAPHVYAVAPEINRSATLTYMGERLDVPVVGTTPEYEYVRNFPVELGEFLTVGDETTGARVVVLGSRTAKNLVEDPASLIGDTVRLNNIPFRVIGILEEKGGQGFGGGSVDNQAVIPLSTAQRRLFSGRFATATGLRVDLINVSAVDEDSIDAAIEEVTWILRERHNIRFEEDDFTVTSQQDVLGVLSQITNVLTIFLGAIAGISLLVGGIGIMNIMLVSVTERTREIGIRKAVGARRTDILSQFLVESVVLSIIGGLIGIGFGWGVAALVNTLDAFTTVVSPQAVALAVSFSLAVGLFFGIYPASRAANLHPIQALRYE
ncbi:MAG TPA: FtsX-like permease family protein [Chloroflexi bacterium]|jgi:putative ABC transport system permease protein|nr:FtsX-like permease family protein [Chloroflexota bacterium]